MRWKPLLCNESFKIMMGRDLSTVIWYLTSPCRIRSMLMVPQYLCPFIKGFLLIVLYLICSLWFNSMETGYSTTIVATVKHHSLHPPSLILSVDASHLHYFLLLIKKILLHRLRATPRRGHDGRGDVNE